MRRHVLVGVLLAVLPSFGLSGQSLQTLTSTRLLRGEDSIAVRVEFGAGRFTLKAGPASALYRARLEYDDARFRPRVEYDPEGRSLLVGVGGRRGRDGRRVRGNHGRDLPQALALELSPRVVTDLSLTLGAVEADVDLGGVPLSRVTLKGGASETRIDFSRPNPATCSRLDVMVGAGEFQLNRIGNSRCRAVSFQGGVGDLRVDLTGDWRESADVVIKMALGDLEVVLPPQAAAEVQLSKLLASFSWSGLERVGGGNTWRTTNWDQATVRLHVQIDAAFGGISVRVGEK